MAKIPYLHRPPGRDDLYFRRKISEPLRPLFNCGDFYKVPLGTKDAREAASLLAIANGEYEKKAARFRETLKSQGSGSLSPEEAKALVERYLTGRSASGFASGGVAATFILLELDKAVDDLAGSHVPSAQSMKAEEWKDYRQRVSGTDDDDGFSKEALAWLEADHAVRHRPPGSAWFAYHDRVPRRRWRPLLTSPIEALKRRLASEEGVIPGIDEPLADALAAALQSPEVSEQLPQAPSARRRDQKSRARPDMKLGALLIDWKKKRNPTPRRSSRPIRRSNTSPTTSAMSASASSPATIVSSIATR